MNVEKEGVLCKKKYSPASESQLYFLPPLSSPGLQDSPPGNDNGP